MYSKEELNEIYEKIVATIDISNSLFDAAEREYKSLGEWINRNTPNYKISIYPQGSFALGTVIKPISDDDDYDLDLVCEFSNNYIGSAKYLKNNITKPLLERYNRIQEIEEKKRCWQFRYEHAQNFHMDVIPAIYKETHISITNKDKETSEYDYIGSNPKGYVEWFNDKKKLRRQILLENFSKSHVIKCQADIEELKEYNFKTPLQKAIQLLKRHRDIMFQEDADNKPISIIITTISADLYKNEDNIFDTLDNILSNADEYINSRKKQGKYFITNPSYTGNESENFADKWESRPELAVAFFDWLEDAKNVFVSRNINQLSKEELLNFYGVALGDKTIKRAFAENKNAIKFIELKSEEPVTSLVPYKVKDIMFAPYREHPHWGKIPKGSRVMINAIATLPSGEKVKLQSDGKAVDKGTKIEFTAIYGGSVKRCTIRWQIVNYGEYVPLIGRRGTFESDKTGKIITENCEYTGHHGVQCYVTQGNNKTLYKSEIFIVNIQ